MRRFLLIGVALLIGVNAVQACETGLSITANLADGKIIKLDDGSVWKINSVDANDSRFWSVGDDVVACDDKLLNIDESEEVEAVRIK